MLRKGIINKIICNRKQNSSGLSVPLLRGKFWFESRCFQLIILSLVNRKVNRKIGKGFVPFLNPYYPTLCVQPYTQCKVVLHKMCMGKVYRTAFYAVGTTVKKGKVIFNILLFS